MKDIEILTGKDNEILRKQSEKISFSDAKKIIPKMKIAIDSQPALGLAAPQIGINKRVILVKIGKSFVVMINPQIIEKSPETAISEEGCLSLPNIWGNVERFFEITVEFTDEKNNAKKIRINDLDARVVQHEIDHLNGLLFVDKILHGAIM